MKNKCLFLFVIISVNINAQSVGVGTFATLGKLTVIDSTSQYNYVSFLGNSKVMAPNVRSSLGFGGTNYTTGAISTIGINASTARMVFYTGYTTGSILTSPERITIANGGFVGINNSNPQANLDLIGNMKVSSFNSIEFGAGVASKETNAGKIGYQTFTTDALDIVGAGTSTTNRKVQLYAEAGTTFTGPINIAGPLQVYGNSGTAGQVLTSNGTSAAVWKDQALTNNVRFAVQLSNNASSYDGDCAIFLTQYNLSPADVSIGTNSITINKTGLYHFDIGLYTQIGYAGVPVNYPRFGIWFFAGYPNSFRIVGDRIMNADSPAKTEWSGDDNGSIEVYVVAPAIIRVYHTIGIFNAGTAITGWSAEGFLTGHLISQ